MSFVCNCSFGMVEYFKLYLLYHFQVIVPLNQNGVQYLNGNGFFYHFQILALGWGLFTM